MTSDWYVLVTRVPKTGVQHVYGPCSRAEARRLKTWIINQEREWGRDPADIEFGIHKMIWGVGPFAEPIDIEPGSITIGTL